MSDYLFLTGSTGLLGRYLVKDLLQSGCKLALLVRQSKDSSAAERIEAILQHWEKELDIVLPRPVLIHGDLRQPNLGLSDSDIRWVAKHCRAVMHSAASLKFHEDGSGEPWLTNLDGTRNMLSLCRETNIRELHYVSTAYVCGLREGTIYEHDLDFGQSFRNAYEDSKLQAEKLVRSADYIDSLTVYRPAVISGDSENGYTNTYHGIYLYLRLMALVVPRQPLDENGQRFTPFRLPMTGEERRNVVPIDWVSAVIAHLFSNKAAHGHTFHLAPEHCLTPREIIDAGYSYFNSTGVEWIGYEPIDPTTLNPLEAEILPSLAMYNEYESTDPHFDRTNVQQFASHIPCPAIDQSMLHRYIAFGEMDRWGKRRVKVVSPEATPADFFQQLEPLNELPENCRAAVSLNVLGIGGGQWTLVLDSDESLRCVPGLVCSPESTVSIGVSEFLEIVQAPSAAPFANAIERLFPQTMADTTSESRQSTTLEISRTAIS